MPGYQYRCPAEHETAIYRPIGRAPRKWRCDECGQTMKLVIGAGVHIAISGLENKGYDVRMQAKSDDMIDADRAAYRRIRRRGLQPESVMGAAQLENEVGDQFDIDQKHLYALDSKENIKERLDAAALLQAET